MKNSRTLLPVMAFTVLMVFCVYFIPATGFAQCENPANPVADVIIEPDRVIFVPLVNYAWLDVTISRPDGTIFTRGFESGNEPQVSLGEILGEGRLDCSYVYELRVTPDLHWKERNGPDGEIKYSQRALVQNGGFTVERGVLVDPQEPEPGNEKSIGDSISGAQHSGSGTMPGLSGVQDYVINDDLIVDGSACIGFDCANGESFGFDTIRLKENNLRIKFDDTSTLASFPRNDWQLTANDSANGGASKFSIDDITNARTPFTVEANARSNSLYVDDGGRIGIRTSTPSVEIHVIDGDTPALRLQQDGSSGFAPQTWDVAGNETNFFIRDVTNGSTLPFRIRPGAPSSSIFIDTTGDVGIGTSSPDYSFEVERTGEGAQMIANRTDGATMEFSASGSYGIAGTKTNHPVRLRVNDNMIMQLNGSGNYIEMIGGGTYNGTWNPSSSRELKENIADLTTDEAMEALVGLNPVKFNYKRDKTEPRVGFIAEDVPDLVALNGRKSLGTVDIIAVLTKVIQEQQKFIHEQEKINTELKKKIEALEKK